MPLFTEAATDRCTEDRPCLPQPSTGYCVSCQARDVLTPGDWAIVGFYAHVRDQYINQTPMGVKDGPPVLTPRLEGWEAALRIHGYDADEWPVLIDGASLLHRCVHSRGQVLQLLAEAGLRYDTVTPADVCDGDAN